MNTHFHTHVNTHYCGCGQTHISAHTHAHTYQLMQVQMPQTPPQQMAKTLKSPPSPIAKRTRSKQQRATWESSPWAVADADIADLLDFLKRSDDPWERSLIPAVEQDAIERFAKRTKMTES